MHSVFISLSLLVKNSHVFNPVYINSLWFYFQSETNGFADFHLYVCAAFLTRFSKELLREKDFQVGKDLIFVY